MILVIFFLFNISANNIEFIINKLDQLYRAEFTYIKISMTIENPVWTRTILADTWTDGTSKSFIRILEPAKDKGIATLRIDNEIWNYFPKISKTIKISPSMMMSSWMNTELTNDDILKISTFNKDYSTYFVETANNNNYTIEARLKKESNSIWGKIIIVLDKNNLLPLKKDYYDHNNNLIRTLIFKEIKLIDNKEIPSVVEIISYKNKDTKTILKYLEAKFNKKLDKDIFTLRNLQKGF